MTKVKVRHGESLEQALRRFNKQVQDTLDEYKDRMFFKKPSELKRLKKKELARKIYWERKKGNY
ncbi:30S ribosomal protein S21 [Patescibacteria group bacterium]|nr:30S ribosomal protein S21 [Patescibacteria group bacterium]